LGLPSAGIPPRRSKVDGMEPMDEFFDDENIELENMREQRKRSATKNFARLINKRDLSSFELDELFM